jgi:hypothetical protein
MIATTQLAKSVGAERGADTQAVSGAFPSAVT